MYLWWETLWVMRQCLAAPTMSHSQVEEWISGSFIQSHCPCSTLWAISMFSMILARARLAVPAHQHTRLEPKASSIRPATSSPRWAAMVRWM